MYLEIFTYGVHTARYCGGFSYKNNTFLTSCGAGLALWDYHKKERLKYIQTNKSLVFCLL